MRVAAAETHRTHPAQPADSRWDEAVDEHRTALAAFLDTAEQLTDDAWGAPWGPGKWARGQVVEHMTLAYEALVAELREGRKMAPRVPRWQQNLLRWVLLPHILFHRRFPLRARAPRETRPLGETIPPGTLIPRLRQAAERFEQELEAARHRGGGFIDTPYFGTVDPTRALRFCAVHLEHHRRQVAPPA
jgi:hypothetical protein